MGKLARSVAVFKAKSIELLQKKGELERLNLQLDAAINNMPLGLSMFDSQERLLVCNKHYGEMYDLPSELAQPGTVRCAIWDYREKKGARHYPTDEDGTPGSEHAGTMTIEFGNERIIAVARQPLKGGGWVALHEDITQRRRQEQEITHLARHDVLTNLANRALFREQLQQALLRLRRGQGFAVFCLDLDRFKAVNDTLGHPVGDVLLKQVSERLLSCVRQGDLVARLGGDEFAIIQANVRDIDSTEALAARIVETISKPYEINGHRIDISTSIGIDAGTARRLRCGPAHEERRPCPLPDEGRRPERLLLLQARDECPHPGAPQARDRSARGNREGGARALLSAARLPPDAEGDGLRRSDALDAPRARHNRSRPSSSRWPRRSGWSRSWASGPCAGPARRRRAGPRRSRWRSTCRPCRSSAT